MVDELESLTKKVLKLIQAVKNRPDSSYEDISSLVPTNEDINNVKYQIASSNRSEEDKEKYYRTIENLEKSVQQVLSALHQYTTATKDRLEKKSEKDMLLRKIKKQLSTDLQKLNKSYEELSSSFESSALENMAHQMVELMRGLNQQLSSAGLTSGDWGQFKRGFSNSSSYEKKIMIAEFSSALSRLSIDDTPLIEEADTRDIYQTLLEYIPGSGKQTEKLTFLLSIFLITSSSVSGIRVVQQFASGISLSELIFRESLEALLELIETIDLVGPALSSVYGKVAAKGFLAGVHLTLVRGKVAPEDIKQAILALKRSYSFMVKANIPNKILEEALKTIPLKLEHKEGVKNAFKTMFTELSSNKDSMEEQVPLTLILAEPKKEEEFFSHFEKALPGFAELYIKKDNIEPFLADIVRGFNLTLKGVLPNPDAAYPLAAHFQPSGFTKELNTEMEFKV